MTILLLSLFSAPVADAKKQQDFNTSRVISRGTLLELTKPDAIAKSPAPQKAEPRNLAQGSKQNRDVFTQQPRQGEDQPTSMFATTPPSTPNATGTTSPTTLSNPTFGQEQINPGQTTTVDSVCTGGGCDVNDQKITDTFNQAFNTSIQQSQQTNIKINQQAAYLASVSNAVPVMINYDKQVSALKIDIQNQINQNTEINKILTNYAQVMTTFSPKGEIGTILQEKISRIGQIGCKWTQCRQSLDKLISAISSDSQYIQNMIKDILAAPQSAMNIIKTQVETLAKKYESQIDQSIRKETVDIIEATVQSSIMSALKLIPTSGNNSILTQAFQAAQNTGQAYIQFISSITTQMRQILETMNNQIKNITNAEETKNLFSSWMTGIEQTDNQVKTDLNAITNVQNNLNKILTYINSTVIQSIISIRQKCETGGYQKSDASFDDKTFQADSRVIEKTIQIVTQAYKTTVETKGKTTYDASSQLIPIQQIALQLQQAPSAALFGG